MREIVIPLPTGIDEDIRDRVKRLAADHWGGFTATDARGGWTSPDGSVITEPVEVLTVVADEDRHDATPEQWAKTMARCVSDESDETTVMWFVRQIAAGGFE